MKSGRDERYLKDDVEEASYMMTVALNSVALAELARQFNLANAIICT